MSYRRRYQANAQLAIPKPMRLRDEGILKWARGLGTCEHCRRAHKTEPHHLLSVGSGGPDAFCNVLALCRLCHTAVHDGRIPRYKLHLLIALRLLRSGTRDASAG